MACLHHRPYISGQPFRFTMSSGPLTLSASSRIAAIAAHSEGGSRIYVQLGHGPSLDGGPVTFDVLEKPEAVEALIVAHNEELLAREKAAVENEKKKILAMREQRGGGRRGWDGVGHPTHGRMAQAEVVYEQPMMPDLGDELDEAFAGFDVKNW